MVLERSRGGGAMGGGLSWLIGAPPEGGGPGGRLNSPIPRAACVAILILETRVNHGEYYVVEVVREAL